MDSRKKHCTAVVLAAGSGKRMGSQIPKQFMLLGEKPVLWYSLHVMEQSSIIDDVILVTGEDSIEYVRSQIVELYRFQKVRAIIPGGAERYESVYHALLANQERRENLDGFVFIHDGARPFLTEQILQDLYQSVAETRACVIATRVKDTIKISDASQMVVSTPDRSTLWAVQTPQVFEEEMITAAYEQLMQNISVWKEQGVTVTDDAMVVETICHQSVTLVEGSYRNLKITTPEDMLFAQALLAETPI